MVTFLTESLCHRVQQWLTDVFFNNGGYNADEQAKITFWIHRYYNAVDSNYFSFLKLQNRCFYFCLRWFCPRSFGFISLSVSIIFGIYINHALSVHQQINCCFFFFRETLLSSDPSCPKLKWRGLSMCLFHPGFCNSPLAALVKPHNGSKCCSQTPDKVA